MLVVRARQFPFRVSRRVARRSSSCTYSDCRSMRAVAALEKDLLDFSVGEDEDEGVVLCEVLERDDERGDARTRRRRSRQRGQASRLVRRSVSVQHALERKHSEGGGGGETDELTWTGCQAVHLEVGERSLLALFIFRVGDEDGVLCLCGRVDGRSAQCAGWSCRGSSLRARGGGRGRRERVERGCDELERAHECSLWPVWPVVRATERASERSRVDLVLIVNLDLPLSLSL
jgi:hypothetical protein